MNVAEPLWHNLLNLKRQLKEELACQIVAANQTEFVFLKDVSTCFEPTQNSNQNAHWDWLLTREPLELSGFQTPLNLFDGRAFLHFADSTSAELVQIYRHYIPLAASRFIFKDDSFVIAHAAQSLDGKMCTVNGASQWIGNDANLVHAHRIRALVDGIIVGANTMRNEHPKLSVRHVAGDNPKRIVLCNSTEGFSEQDLQNTMVICGEHTHASAEGARSGSSPDMLQIACDSAGNFDITSIRQKLAQAGIYAIMLEGGPCTINQFIQGRGVDWLQIHVAPILFGSGKSIYECESIDCVADALHLQNTCVAQMGDAVMLSGQVPAANKSVPTARDSVPTAETRAPTNTGSGSDN